MNRFAADVLERALVTFGEAFFAALLLSLAGAPAVPSLSIVEKAAGAGVVAVLALLKGVFAGLVGNPSSAALLPAKADAAAPAPPQTDHNPVPPLDPFANLTPPSMAKRAAPKAAKRARNAR